MQHQITHSCGHTETHQIYGTNAAGQRDRKAAHLTDTPCTACRTNARDEARAEAVTQALTGADVTMPELTGTPKQVSWAATLRERALAHLTDRPAAVRAAAGLTEAKWWIDNREDLASALAQLAENAPEPEAEEPATDSTGDWERWSKQEAIYDSMPSLDHDQAPLAERLLGILTVLTSGVSTPWPRAELRGQADMLRHLLVDNGHGVRVRAWANALSSHQLSEAEREELDRQDEAWLREALRAYRSYWDDSDPMRRLQRNWSTWHNASAKERQALDQLAATAYDVNRPDAPRRLTLQQIADAVPAERGRAWAQWIVNRGRKG